MLKSLHLCVWLLLFLGRSMGADAVEFRVLVCKPAIAKAIKSNLDEAKISMDSFETTYDRLTGTGDIQELFRIQKSDWVPGSQLVYTAKSSSGGQAGNSWEVNLQGQRLKSGDSTGYRAQLKLAAAKGNESTEFDANATRSSLSEQWCVLAEFSWNSQRLLWLGRGDEKSADAAQNPELRVEGIVFSSKTKDSASLLNKSPEELAVICDKIALNDDAEVFRIWGGSSGLYGIAKTGENSLDVQLRCLESQNRKLVDCGGQIQIHHGSSTPSLEAGKTIPKGAWSLISTRDLEDGESMVLFLKVTGGQTEPSAIDPISPLPEKGNLTRSYTVHPSAMRILNQKYPGKEPRQTKQLFLDAGIPAGNWKIFYTPGGPSFMVTGDVSVHQKFLEIIEGLWWKE
ncbi:hypothetical protein JIN85_14890 [Luteolibacter pohnpeiensis]|uniref:Uncharacterized protein n=1 Tax=Luteolibacter pohnpeiensis TaxID=454153 RepID=A0A934VVM3_9BACT|nr:hypothetical protein [Luteolibacter pohnpeiensis]MBK1883702.1 hypothetical protein [Luteolibacter pohnpeiensis]